jgi:hypothetical protein
MLFRKPKVTNRLSRLARLARKPITRQIGTLIGELVASDVGAGAWLSALDAIRIQRLLVKLGCVVAIRLDLCSA